MRHRPLLLARLRSPRRARWAGWPALFALLVQLAVGAPLAARMALDAALAPPAGAGEAHCGEHAAPAHGGGTAPAPAKSHHRHEHCVLCQAAAMPLLAAAVPVAMAPAAIDEAPPPRLAAASPPRLPAHLAEARAPPRA